MAGHCRRHGGAQHSRACRKPARGRRSAVQHRADCDGGAGTSTRWHDRVLDDLKHYPYVANSDFHKAKHLYSWKTLVRSAKSWPAIKAALKSNVNVAITLFRKDSC
jgi:hypothetical protein